MTQKSTYYHFTNRQSQPMVLEVLITLNLREKGKDLTEERLEGSSSKLVMFCFLIFALITKVCLLGDNSLNYVFTIWSLFYMLYTSIKKTADEVSSFSKG